MSERRVEMMRGSVRSIESLSSAKVVIVFGELKRLRALSSCAERAARDLIMLRLRCVRPDGDRHCC